MNPKFDKFNSYMTEIYPKAIKIMQEEINKNTDFNLLKELTLKLMFIIENNNFPFISNPNLDHLKQIIIKISQELLAVIGCINAGSLYGCYHHLRSLIEVTAISNYLLANDNKKKQIERIKKYYTFLELSKYQFYYKLKMKLEKNEIDLNEFKNQLIINQIDINLFTDEKIQSWKNLWKPDKGDILKIYNWHYPANIDNLITKINFNDLYKAFSNMVHISPLSPGVIGNNLILQKNQIPQIQEIINSSVCTIFEFLEIFNKISNTEFAQSFYPIIIRFKNFKHLKINS